MKTGMIVAALSVSIVSLQATSTMAAPLPGLVANILVGSQIGQNNEQETVTSLGNYSKLAIHTYPDCHGCLPSSGVAFSSVSLNDIGPTLIAEVAGDKTGGLASYAAVQGTYTYFFQASGPSPTVALNWAAAVAIASDPFDLSYSAYPAGQAHFSIQNQDGTRGIVVAGVDWKEGIYSTYGFNNNVTSKTGLSVNTSGTGSFFVNTGQIYSVMMSVYTANILGAGQGGFATGGISVGVDPIISIDRNQVASSAYELSFSDGIKQSADGLTLFPPSLSILSAVPEPNTWAMVIFGFGILGAILRLKRAAPNASCIEQRAN